MSVKELAPLNIFTAIRNLNQIDSTALLNEFVATMFLQATLYHDSDTEVWCTYGPTVTNCSAGGCGFFPGGFNPAGPTFFTVYYKDCLLDVTPPGNLDISELLTNYLNEVDQYPGILEWYYICWASGALERENYFMRRTNYHTSTPKSYQPIEELGDADTCEEREKKI